MLYNYIKIACRNLVRQKSFTLLNVAGLGVGVGAVLLLFQIVRYELSFNKNFKNYDRIVRVVGQRNNAESGQSFQSGMATSAMISAQNSVPQFEVSTRVRMYRPTVMVPNPAGGAPLKKMELPDAGLAVFAEPGFFRIFDFPWIAGSQLKALSELNAVVLSRSMAEACFGRWEDAPGQTLLLNNEPMTVRGIMEDAPVNCDLPVRIVISYATLLANPEQYDYVENWERNRGNDQLYALLKDANSFRTANEAVAQVGKKEYAAASNSKQIGQNTHFLQPLAELHYDTRFGTPGGFMIEKSRLWILSSIGLVVLLLACFNFVNLCTAQALQRAKEVGVRKTLGGSRSLLFGQFMSETALIVLISVGAGAVLARVAAPVLNQISSLPKDLPFFSNPQVWWFLGGLALVVTLFSGFYPALILTGFSPVRALKNEASARRPGGVALRKGLVVFQFAIAQVLLIGTIVSLQQMQFIQNVDLGFQKDLIYMFPFANNPETRPKLNSLKEQILQIPGVESMAMSNLPPASRGSWQTNFSVGRGSADQPFNTGYLFCDADFQKTFGVDLLAGKWFGPADTTTGYVINETLMKKAGIKSPEDAVGQVLRLERDPWYPIVGVVRDFHSKPLQVGFEPLVLASYNGLYVGAGVKISPQNRTGTTAAIKRVFDATFPEQVFNGSYFDESIAHFYAAEDRFAKSCKGFALLAMLISCLGLFGLAAHAAQRRTKEIGIRKVLGATVAGVTGLLARDFLVLVLIAIAVATPLAWYFMQHWLADFTYRIDMHWWMFAAAGLAAVGIAFLTVCFQSVKAALANPVKSLRSE